MSQAGKMALSAGLGALGGAVGSSPQELESFRGTGPLSDPIALLQEGVRGKTRLGQALTERAERPATLGPATIVQSPQFFHGGDLPFPIGLSGQDVGFAPLKGKGLKDPFQNLGQYDPRGQKTMGIATDRGRGGFETRFPDAPQFGVDIDVRGGDQRGDGYMRPTSMPPRDWGTPVPRPEGQPALRRSAVPIGDAQKMMQLLNVIKSTQGGGS